jgi:hypothetical protein
VAGSASGGEANGGSAGTSGTGGSANEGGSAGQGGEAGSPPDVPTCKQQLPADSVVVDAANGADSGSCGTGEAPCKTVNAGLARAAVEGLGKVVVAPGTYVEALELKSPIEVIGGWERKETCWEQTDTLPVIQAPNNKNITVLVNANGQVALRKLEIKSKATAATSESLYGVFATGANTVLVLQNVEIQTAAAGKGANGTKGANGAAADDTCTPSTGADGAAAVATPATASGKFSVSGYAPSPGIKGNDGNDGKAGTKPTGSSQSGCYHCTNPGTNPGQVCGSTWTHDATGYAGCGGIAGKGGTAGGGGGSSIALFVWDASVTLSGGTLTAGNGGQAGEGGPGGTPSAPTKGADDSEPCSKSCTSLDTPFRCILGSTTTLFSAGTTGGKGTAGGKGGDGAGGNSYGIYKGGSATVTVAGVSYVVGAPGTGGVAGTAAQKNF